MYRRLQSGSITPVWLVLVMSTLLLMVLFVDREWVNYQVRKVKQTADFAAEVGSSTAQVVYHLKVDGQKWTKTITTCTGLCTDTYKWNSESWTNTCAGTLAEMSGNGWLARCQCFVGDTSVVSQFTECLKPTEELPTIRWPSAVEDEITSTFQANWVDRPNSRVIFTSVFLDPAIDKRLSMLTVKLLVSSPFGGKRWFSTEFVTHGEATMRIPPLMIIPPPPTPVPPPTGS